MCSTSVSFTLTHTHTQLVHYIFDAIFSDATDDSTNAIETNNDTVETGMFILMILTILTIAVILTIVVILMIWMIWMMLMI